MEDNIFIKKKEKHWVWSFRDISIDTRNNYMNTWTNATRYWLLLKRQFTSKSKLHIFILPVLLFIHLDCFGLSCHVLQIYLALGLCKLKSNLQVASSWSYSPSIQLHNLTAQKDTCMWTRGSCSEGVNIDGILLSWAVPQASFVSWPFLLKWCTLSHEWWYRTIPLRLISSKTLQLTSKQLRWMKSTTGRKKERKVLLILRWTLPLMYSDCVSFPDTYLTLHLHCVWTLI